MSFNPQFDGSGGGSSGDIELDGDTGADAPDTDDGGRRFLPSTEDIQQLGGDSGGDTDREATQPPGGGPETLEDVNGPGANGDAMDQMPEEPSGPRGRAGSAERIEGPDPFGDAPGPVTAADTRPRDFTLAETLSGPNLQAAGEFLSLFEETTTLDAGDRAILGDLTTEGGLLAEDDMGEDALAGPVADFEERTGFDLPGEGAVLPTEQELRQTSRRISEQFDFEREVESTLEDVAGEGLVGDLAQAPISIAGGVARLPGDFAAVPTALPLAGETALETVQNLPDVLDDETPADVAEAGTSVLGETVRSIEESRQEDPGSFIGQVVGGFAAGTLATRATIRGLDAARAARLRSRADTTADFEDLTSPRGAEGDLPLFRTDPDAPDIEAVSEVRRRAADTPEDILDAVEADEALFHSTRMDLPDALDVQRGQAELPGLFTSPDASPLRLLEGAEDTSGGLGIRLPRLRDFRRDPDELAAFPGDRIEAMPASATGARRITDPETGDPIPDPSTAGARFLDETAELETAFVRPRGSRTRELEAIFPPGSAFRRTGTVAVDTPEGRTVPMGVFRRGEGDRPDAPGTLATTQDLIDDFQRRRARQRPEGDPVTPPTGATPTRPTDPTTTPDAPPPAEPPEASPPSFRDPSEPGGPLADEPPTAGTTDPTATDPSSPGTTGPVSGPSGPSRTTGPTSGGGPSTPTPTGPPPTTGGPTSDPPPPTTPTGPPPPPTTPTGPPPPPTTPTGPPPPPTTPTGPPPPPRPPQLSDDRRRRRTDDLEIDPFERVFEEDIISPAEALGDDMDGLPSMDLSDDPT